MNLGSLADFSFADVYYEHNHDSFREHAELVGKWRVGVWSDGGGEALALQVAMSRISGRYAIVGRRKFPGISKIC